MGERHKAIKMGMQFFDRYKCFSIKNSLIILFFLFLVIPAALHGQITYCTDCYGVSGDCADPTDNPDNNPQLTALCGAIDIILVLDESNSIDTIDEINAVKDGTLVFLNSLVCTGTRVAIVEFASTARIVNDYKVVDDAYVSQVSDYFGVVDNPSVNNQNFRDVYGEEGGTNWQAAMLAVDDLNVPDILLFFTDGVPTGYSSGENPTKDSPAIFCSDGSTTQRPEIANPVKLANKFKMEGAHMFMLGVGGATVNTLKKMSGSNELIPQGHDNLGNSDYIVESNFSELTRCFVALASSFCPFSGTVSATDVCTDNTAGIAQISISNTTTQFDYVYYNESTKESLGSGLGVNSPLILDGLAAGEYRVEVKLNVSSSDCERKETHYFEINELPSPTLVSNITNVSCFGANDGEITVTAAGGVPPYTYLWTTSNGTGLQPTIKDQISLSSGDYEVVVTDSQGCAVAKMITVTEPGQLLVTAGADVIIDCNTEIGELTLDGSGSETGNHIVYLWTTIDGAIVRNAETLFPTINKVGTYVLTVTNTLTNCSNTDAVNVSVKNLINTKNSKKTVCRGSILNLNNLVSVQGGAFAPQGNGLNGNMLDTATFGLGTSHTYTYTNTANSLCPTEELITIVISEGEVDKECRVIDADFCDANTAPFYNFYWHAMDSVSGSSFFSQNEDHKLSFVTYKNGTALITGKTQQSGCSVELYIFLKDKKNWAEWTADGGGFKEQGCAGTIKEAMQYYLIDGTKSYIKTKGNCIEEGVYKVTQRPDPNDRNTPNLGGHLGPGGALWDSNKGAEGLASWAWMGPEGNERKWTIDFNFLLDCETAKTCIIKEHDTLACSMLNTFENVHCYGDNSGSATVHVTGGVPPYTYLWDNGETNSTATKLSAGLHTVTVVDGENVKAQASAVIEEPSLLTYEVTVESNVSAYGLSDGVATILVDGGEKPYAYLWDNGENTARVTALEAGEHSVSITDANGCQKTCIVSISQPSPLAVEICDGIDNDNDGEIDEGLDCESIAFARYESNNNCFIENGFKKWGWTNTFEKEGDYILDLYAGAIQCDVNNGKKIGNVLVNYHSGSVLVSVELLNGFTMTSGYLYVGDTLYPTRENKRTIAPEHFPYKSGLLDDKVAFQFPSVNVNSISGELYIIVQLNLGNKREAEGKASKTKITTYPMTFKNDLNLSVQINYDAQLEIEMFDVNGRKIMTKKRKRVKAGANNVHLNVSSLAPEVYFLKIDTGKEKIIKKVMSEK